MSISTEPVVWGAAIRAVILVGTAFGLKWTAEQIAAIMLAVEAIFAIFTRKAVTPNANL